MFFFSPQVYLILRCVISTDDCESMKSDNFI